MFILQNWEHAFTLAPSTPFSLYQWGRLIWQREPPRSQEWPFYTLCSCSVLASPFLWIFSLCYEVVLQMQDSRKKKKIIYGLDGLRVHDVRAFLTAES
jgi:hypothetical protein